MSGVYPLLTLTQIKNLLQARFEEGFLTLRDLPQPSLFKDMDKATERIISAIKNNEKIMIIGDYDVDGVTSTTLMKLFFEEIDYAVEWIIPNRFRDGYGLSAQIVPRIAGTDLAITVDNGISAVYAAQVCKEAGIELIITDHHLLSQEIPECYAIINPKQERCTFPYEDLCGAQIAWYLIASLKNALGIQLNLLPYMELVAIAIIADMMPLLHINRMMVEAGIQALNKSSKPAIRAFLEHSQKETLSAEDIGFFLAPLLNSAGRMEDASYAVEFLSSTNIYDARVRLERLIGFNTLRKATEQEMTAKALAKVNTEHKVIVVEGKEWHEGVVGIVAARLARHHEKPCIVLSNDGKGGLKGSGRSFGACDLFSITNSCREYLEKFGGHQAAIGLSLQEHNVADFTEQLQLGYAKAGYVQEGFDPAIMGELHFSDISFELTGLIKEFEPYGQANPTPKFISKKVEILQVQSLGKEGEHLRFSFAQEGIVIPGVQFKTRQTYDVGSSVDIIYMVNENHFRGNVTLQLMIEKILG
ncbi:MAG TPA: single-stranded-DNA-specific exonuclease RecJ [Sulfurovum sp.]|jgi:single-stranded-DNA-specific exonuclease|nr:MAG: single-stranded-DNA-specific exonuclease RecJ [Sulfurovum sp. 35-42-20]OYZ25579.1 MAG: single-stranded-DNA-specific exonuclease RecJ [Sulfurovum sp. 16-42-52]OYZ49590.1 MAG: single-stranded-DNA-specific exonuclease RecJ [Sulfurovum sp. 24-42-9]OZA45567.1 MAG: single-stranded-DNA-specific exonuclease RecJ [Sulfurovum sp. 17-42-90]OZA59609.1 MAG: single-stranded-DNA-specific exonuclease RecJ [Sulfurovum sp. 39-42-12]HQR74657.1 single-stranded-DNA-specific exonuclease RecJ [Sulfurovum sp.